MNNDFEVMPIGTANRLKELEEALAKREKEPNHNCDLYDGGEEPDKIFELETKRLFWKNETFRILEALERARFDLQMTHDHGGFNMRAIPMIDEAIAAHKQRVKDRG